ncbi:MAG: chromosome segregation protein SMC [Gammaproteobacteria bacterium]|nr:chromosome segregation protein SMC [Gammaproteobacteria bacterium]
MRITKIKLAGFKSFVDPTTLHLPGNLTGVVGPNGCGKSNIIDAMMWVMGETSAKHLRGDSMADVIFSGSSSRKPIGQASVELEFDNSDGALGGAYAGFAEISIKRSVTRDGLSNYFLNNTRCRRKDIIDVFLGTGLGARGSYSVIEQGMISRVIEAKPDELRGFLEEAAGISKYRERRRETETRMRHTNENLARVNDVREELAKQLGHLQRQAKAAEKYQELKSEERRAEAELLGLRWRDLDAQRANQRQLITERETAVEAANAALRRVEALQSSLRSGQTSALEAFNARQSEFYGKSAEVSRLEQAIAHTRDTRQGLEAELHRSRFSLENTAHLHDEDLQKHSHLATEIASWTPEEVAREITEDEGAEQLRRTEESAEAWQAEWDQFNRQQAEAARLEHAENVRLEMLQTGFADAQQRAAVLESERAQLDLIALAQLATATSSELQNNERTFDELTGSQQQTREALLRARTEVQTQTQTLHSLRSELQQAGGQEASLTALQKAALGYDSEQLTTWLTKQGLGATPILANALEIAPGWEAAVETALRLPLSTFCGEGVVERILAIERNTFPSSALGAIEVTAVEPQPPLLRDVPRLIDKVRSKWSMETLLAGIYAAPDLAVAHALRPRLTAFESVITPEGVWLGSNWVQIPGRATRESGVLTRQRVLEELAHRCAALRAKDSAAEAELQRQQAALTALEERDRLLNSQIRAAHAAVASTKNQLVLQTADRERMQNRVAVIATELTQLAQKIHDNESTILGLRERLHTLRTQLTDFAARGEALNVTRRTVQAELEARRNAWRTAREARHEVALKLEGLRSTHSALSLALNRNARLVEELTTRCSELEAQISASVAPQQDLATQLEQALSARSTLEEGLKASRNRLDECDSALRRADEEHVTSYREIQQRSQLLEQVRLEDRALEVRLQELEDRITQQEQTVASVLENMLPTASEHTWRERSESLANKISRLGPINLAAIDEFAQLSERKTYLDNQFDDLSQALATLEDAIRKIDKETRTRFKETFDKVNSGMQAMFPVLFGGGHAYLELVGEDLLETGVTVMARPPGKRNSTIHLLSGGEKALTALAFVFSLFELNPAPFCLLDEVDAPLDDANVVRLTDMLKSMSMRVQFLFVTHNKITMEIAEQLIGVTMQEAGVSRLVSVNMEEAVALAESA